MEFVAERFRRKFVALVYAGSNPVKLPRVSLFSQKAFPCAMLHERKLFLCIVQNRQESVLNLL